MAKSQYDYKLDYQAFTLIPKPHTYLLFVSNQAISVTDLVLFQPDIAGNTGTLMRLAACWQFTLHIIEPAGFSLDDTALKRSGMDYRHLASLKLHSDWQQFVNWKVERCKKLILLTTQSNQSFYNHRFTDEDMIVLGRESSGAQPYVHDAAHKRLCVPVAANCRSINLALCGSIVMAEALRQTGGFDFS